MLAAPCGRSTPPEILDLLKSAKTNVLIWRPQLVPDDAAPPAAAMPHDYLVYSADGQLCRRSERMRTDSPEGSAAGSIKGQEPWANNH